MRSKAAIGSAVLLLLAAPAASEWVPYGAPADVPPLSEILLEGNSTGDNGINLSGNALVGVGSTDCGPDAAITGDGNCDVVGVLDEDKYVDESGDNVTGNLNLSFNRIRSLDPPVATRDAATKGYVDTQIVTKTSDDQNLSEVLEEGAKADRDIDLNGNSVTTSTGEVCIGDQCS